MADDRNSVKDRVFRPFLEVLGLLLEHSDSLRFEKRRHSWMDFLLFKKFDSTLTGWKSKVEDSESYQKTVTSFNEGGKKVSSGISSAGTKIKENETLKNVGEKTSSALKRTGTVIKDTGTAIKENETIKSMGSKISGAAYSLKEKVWYSGDQAEDTVPNGNGPTKGETVIPDEP